jgi:hypothetical protein
MLVDAAGATQNSGKNGVQKHKLNSQAAKSSLKKATDGARKFMKKFKV